MKRILILLFLFRLAGSGLEAKEAGILPQSVLKRTEALAVVFSTIYGTWKHEKVVYYWGLSLADARALGTYVHLEFRPVDAKRPHLPFVRLYLDHISPRSATIVGAQVWALEGTTYYEYSLRYSKGRWRIFSKHFSSIS